LTYDPSTYNMVGAPKLLLVDDSPIATRAIPVIMLTSEGAPEEIECCFQAGCNGYIAKPVNIAALKPPIEAVLADEVG
jgi:CheY-like chemotaxis protein